MIATATTGRIPDELLRTVPRQVTLSGAGKLVTVIVVLCCAGIVADLVGTTGQVRLRRMTDEGVLISAEVLETTMRRGEHPRQVITYRYQAGGEWREGRTTLGEKDRRRLPSGAQIDVKYLPSRPEVSWIPGYEPGFPLWAVPIIPGVLAIVVGLLARELRRQRGLLSNGRAALATVTQSRKMRKGDHRTYRIDYEFKLLSGATRTGHCDVQRNPPAAGATMVIIYDPEDPRRAARYPLSLVRTSL